MKVSIEKFKGFKQHGSFTVTAKYRVGQIINVWCEKGNTKAMCYSCRKWGDEIKSTFVEPTFQGCLQRVN